MGDFLRDWRSMDYFADGQAFSTGCSMRENYANRVDGVLRTPGRFRLQLADFSDHRIYTALLIAAKDR